MRLFGRALLVLVIVCLLPARSEGALIDLTPTPPGTLDPGAYPLIGSFETDNDIGLFAFSLTETSTVTVELTSFLCADGTADCDSITRGFDPILTLLAAGTFDLIESAVSVTGDDPFVLQTALNPGNYLLAITQYDNFYSGGGAFDHDDLPTELQNFTEFFFDPEDVLECDAFIAITPEPECRNNTFAGTLTVESESTVAPEPGVLSLLGAGCTAIALRRRRRRSRREDSA